jgi:pimeloyl-ACP methyl ester carboxylesterase
MLRFLAIIGLIMTSIWDTSNVARVPSGIGALNIFIRYTAPTGTRRRVPVLILHGATFPSANAAGWKFDGRSWMDELASAGYDVYALDFLGYGVSDRYPEMSSAANSGAPLGDVGSMITQVESAVQYIFKVHGVKTVNLVAHSAGTYVAARYAELHPQDVERLVLFGAPAPYNGPTKVDIEAVRYLQVGREDQLEAFEPRVRDSHLLDPAMFETWIRAYLATDPASASRAPPSVRVPAGLTAAYEEMLRSGRLPYDPNNITVPTLIIQGEWDAVAPPAAGLWIYKHLASPLKRYVIISKAGHRAHLERNRWQLYSETESFLGGGELAR